MPSLLTAGSISTARGLDVSRALSHIATRVHYVHPSLCLYLNNAIENDDQHMGRDGDFPQWEGVIDTVSQSSTKKGNGCSITITAVSCYRARCRVSTDYSNSKKPTPFDEMRSNLQSVRCVPANGNNLTYVYIVDISYRIKYIGSLDAVQHKESPVTLSHLALQGKYSLASSSPRNSNSNLICNINWSG